MKTHRDQNQQPARQQFINQKHAESPQVLRERPSGGSEFNHISPIPQNESSKHGGNLISGSHYTTNQARDSTGLQTNIISNEKYQNDPQFNIRDLKKSLQPNISQKNLVTIQTIKTDRQYQNQKLQQQQHGYQNKNDLVPQTSSNQKRFSKNNEYDVSSSSANLNEDTTPMHIHNFKQQILPTEFYKRPSQNFVGNEEGGEVQSDNGFGNSNPDAYSNTGYLILNQNEQAKGGFNLYGAPSNMNVYSQSTGNNKQGGLTKQQQRDYKQAACTEFDLTAKEINSNKRFGDKQIKKNTIISGLTDHSPLDGQPSNSETVKWAFTNKDSQETLKKISIINRESLNNAQDIIQKSLKSHDSRAQLSQQTNSQNKLPAIKGKILDFADADLSEHQQNFDSDDFYNQQLSNPQSKFHKQEEEKMISFLEDETELLMTSNKKLARTQIMGNQMIAGIQYKKHSDNLKNKKYCSLLKFNLPDNMQTMIENTQDCILCNKQKVFDSSLQCSNIEEPKSCMDVIQMNLNKKYLTSREYYNVKIINDIIYNEQTNIVSVFKDYLIFDDISEFLKRFYNKLEAVSRLPRMFGFYEKLSKVFPNYVILPENKYLFKNIEKKQRILDEKQRILQEQEEKKQRDAQGFQLGQSNEKPHRSKHRDRFSSQQMQNSSNFSQFSTDRMFNTKFIDSVANIHASGVIESMMSSRIHNSQYQEHVLNSSILIHQHLQQNMDNAAKNKQKKRALQDLDFDELISKFIAKDSLSTIQQSSIMSQTQDNRKQEQPQQIQKDQPLLNSRPLSSQQIQKQPKIYEYQEMAKLPPQQNIDQPVGSTILNTENSKSISDGVSSSRPTSSKQKIDSRFKIKDQQKQLQNPINNQAQAIIQPRPINQIKSNEEEDKNQGNQIINPNNQAILVPQHQPSSSNHLIINNFLQDQNQGQKQCDIIINIASSNIITSQNMPPSHHLNSDRNYYDYNNMHNYNGYQVQPQQNHQLNQQQQQQQQQQLTSIKVISSQDGKQQIVHIPQPTSHEKHDQQINEVKVIQNQQAATSSRQGSLQRSQSRSNLHNVHNSQKSTDGNNKNCQTPHRTTHQQEIKTPGSGKPGETQIKTNLVQQKILKRIKQQNKIDNLQQHQFDMQQNMISLSGNNKSASLIQQKSQNIIDNTSSPLNIYTQRQQIYTMNVNSAKGGATEAVVSRELSKDKPKFQQNQIQIKNNNLFQGAQTGGVQSLQSSQGHSNQMFKNDILSNLAGKLNQEKFQAEYSSNLSGKIGMNNVRSIERLNKIEEEIQKDYSKYVNEYGLSKTAFAKAVNSLREKQQQNAQTFTSQQHPQSQPSTTRQTRLMQNSNEKKRTGSNNPRTGSTSQNRKQSNSRQQNIKTNLQPQESINDIYLNTNRQDQKQIRSVRAKTYLNSQNSSSCFQRSQKLSPDKISTSNFGIQNILGMTQNITNNLNNNNSNYLTLKAQPSKQNKGIKIKFPINNQQQQQRANSKNNQNQSQTQTPKRIKLQKTKSTSNIPITFTQRAGQAQVAGLLTNRGRSGALNSGDMMIIDEINATQANNLQYLQQNSRLNQNYQDLYNQNLQNDRNIKSIISSGNGMSSQNGVFPQQNFNTNSCLGTYATTSILSSPLQFKNQTTRNNSKGRQSSRNGGNSQHQSQKSIQGAHQRASSNNGVLQSSNNKKKAVAISATNNNAGNESKRMSTGSNMSKKGMAGNNIGTTGATPIHHQVSSSNMQQQILQLLMAYQTQQQSNDQCDLTATTNTNANNTFKLLQGGANSHSMKDLKSLKQHQVNQTPSAIMKDLQIMKMPQSHQQQHQQVLQQSQPSLLNTQRQGQSIQSILMVDNQNSRKQIISKGAGKLTSRGESNKKRVINQQQNIGAPYGNISNNDCTTSITLSANNQNHYSLSSNLVGGNMTSNDLSSRIQNSITGQGALNYTGAEDMKRMLASSKSQENFDILRVAAQRAALEQQQQQFQSQYNTTLGSSQLATNKFLQNLKQQENQISLSTKIKMLPSNVLSSLPLQSARNIQFDNRQHQQNQHHQNDSDPKINQQLLQTNNQVQFSKGATNIIIGNGQNFEKPSSRRTSGKFNPQSTKSNQQ